MKCEDMRELLAPYFDGELAAPEARAVERHLAECPGCAEVIARWGEVRGAVRALDVPHPDAAFAARLGGALVQAARPQRARLPRRAIAAGLALVLFGAIFGAVGAFAVFSRTAPDDRIVHDVVAAHVRSLLAASPVEVASADTHAVKPWFAGHLPFAPPVESLLREGFDLVGGRLDYVDGREVAAIVLKRQRHIVNLLIWPHSGEDAPVRMSQERGFTLANWRRGGLAFWAVSDMGMGEMKTLAGDPPRGR